MTQASKRALHAECSKQVSARPTAEVHLKPIRRGSVGRLVFYCCRVLVPDYSNCYLSANVNLLS